VDMVKDQARDTVRPGKPIPESQPLEWEVPYKELASGRPVEFAPKTSLREGEQITLRVTVTGIQEPDPLPLPWLELRNMTPEVVRLEGGDTQTIPIYPEDVSPGGTFTFTRTLTGISSGGWFAIVCQALPAYPHREGVTWPPHTEGVSWPPYHDKRETWPPHRRKTSWTPPPPPPPPHLKDVTSPPHHAEGKTWPPHLADVTWPPYHDKRETWPQHLADVTWPPPYHVEGTTWPPHKRKTTWWPPHLKGVTFPPHTKGVTFPPYDVEHVKDLSWRTHKRGKTWGPPEWPPEPREPKPY
jgi:hypothetical protein